MTYNNNSVTFPTFRKVCEVVILLLWEEKD